MFNKMINVVAAVTVVMAIVSLFIGVSIMNNSSVPATVIKTTDTATFQYAASKVCKGSTWQLLDDGITIECFKELK